MKPHRKNILSMMDNTLRWTGIPARVANEMSDDPSVDRTHRTWRTAHKASVAVSAEE